MKLIKFVCVLFIVCDAFFAKAQSVKNDASCALSVKFSNKVGNEVLELGKNYLNPFNEPFNVSRFKYYISNLTFYTTNGAEINIPSSYYLVNEEDSASKNFSLQLQKGSYHKLSFSIGVDSIKNVSGTQTDALDPMNGMFWTWNSGYIMAKLEGTSPLSKSPNQMIEYHIGGFRHTQNTIRKVTLLFEKDIELTPGSNPSIRIETDINKWFGGKHDLKIAAHTACMTPGDLAMQYADNYATMFTIVSNK